MTPRRCANWRACCGRADDCSCAWRPTTFCAAGTTANGNIVRRYRRGPLRQKLADAGLRVLVSSYANTWLFPVALAKRWSEIFRVPSEETSDLQIGAGRGLVPTILRTLMTSERRWVTAGSLPFGLSLYALAEKPK